MLGSPTNHSLSFPSIPSERTANKTNTDDGRLYETASLPAAPTTTTTPCVTTHAPEQDESSRERLAAAAAATLQRTKESPAPVLKKQSDI